jgi:hypothetical protein
MPAPPPSNAAASGDAASRAAYRSASLPATCDAEPSGCAVAESGVAGDAVAGDAVAGDGVAGGAIVEDVVVASASARSTPNGWAPTCRLDADAPGACGDRRASEPASSATAKVACVVQRAAATIDQFRNELTCLSLPRLDNGRPAAPLYSGAPLRCWWPPPLGPQRVDRSRLHPMSAACTLRALWSSRSGCAEVAAEPSRFLA